MGSIQQNHRLTPNQILGHCRVLALALQEQKLNNIKLALREKKFVRGVITTTNTAAILLGMALITELGALRGLTLLLLTILIGLSFYLLFDALDRCKEVTERLNQEISDMHVLAEDPENEEEKLIIKHHYITRFTNRHLGKLAFFVLWTKTTF